MSVQRISSSLTRILKPNLGELTFNKNPTIAAVKNVTAVTALSLMSLYRTTKNALEGKKPVRKEYAKDTVVLYQFPRAYNSPSLSMFALKLETWCRAANIKYQNEFGMKRSSQGMIPFISLNGYVVEDSQKCIEYLSKVFEKDLNANLTEEQKAVSRLVLKMCDDSLRWAVVLYRFWLNKNGQKEMNLPLLSYWYFRYRVYKSGLYTGYGLLSERELIESAQRDLKAINTLIGNKKFLFSDSQPCDTDFAIFGLTAQIKFNDRAILNRYLNNECQNIVRHIDTIVQMYWPDWDQNTQKYRKAMKKQTIEINQAK